MLASLALAVLLPLPLDDYFRSVLWLVGIYVLLGLGLNIIVGYAGLFQLGHAAFYAIGAYTAGMLNLQLGHPAARDHAHCDHRAAGLAGFIVSRPILHLRGDYLAIVTIAFGEILRMLLVNNVGGVTGGANGLFGIAPLEIFGFSSYTSPQQLLPGALLRRRHDFAVNRLENSRLGRAWMYVREDQSGGRGDGHRHGAGQGDGIRPRLGLGRRWPACYTPAASARFRRNWAASSNRSSCSRSSCWAAWARSPGVIVGAIGMIGLPEVFRFVKDWRDGFVGLAMVLMMIFRPAGLLPSRRVAVEETDEATEVAAPADRRAAA